MNKMDQRNVSSTAIPVPTSTESPRVSVWVPITVILSLAIFSAIMVLCSHKFKRMCQKNLRNDRVPSGNINIVQMNFNTLNDRNVAPETPPPAYASLERQFSYVSHISHNSSQIEIPPDYDTTSEVAATSSLERGLRGTCIAGSSRFFSRSISALESRTPSKALPPGIHFSSSMVVSHALICEDQTPAEEEGSSNPLNTRVPDVVKETSPKHEYWQRNCGPSDVQKEMSGSSRDGDEIVFSISEDSQSVPGISETLSEETLPTARSHELTQVTIASIKFVPENSEL